MAIDRISVRGARQHNLKNVNVDIPRDRFTVITGLSGSGKSSLAFDTIYAEGQRRYVESLSAYARQFLDQLEKPDVDSVDGLSPAIGVNIMEFCKAFNAKTAQMDPDLKIPVVITVFGDRSFTFETKTPPAAGMLAIAAGMLNASGKERREKGATLASAEGVAVDNVYVPEPTTTCSVCAIKTIEGTARKRGLAVAELAFNDGHEPAGGKD